MVKDTSADYCLVSRSLIEDRLVSAKAKAMYAVLCCSPELDHSYDNLADILRISKASASKLIRELEDIGYIEHIKIQSQDAKHDITSYKINPRPFI